MASLGHGIISSKESVLERSWSSSIDCESSYKLDSGKYIKMKYVLFVPGLKKNILSISALDAKGMRVCWRSKSINTIADLVDQPTNSIG